MTRKELKDFLDAIQAPCLAVDRNQNVVQANRLAQGTLLPETPDGVAWQDLTGLCRCDIVVDEETLTLLLSADRCPHDKASAGLHKERLELATDIAGIGVFDRVLCDDSAPPPFWTPSMRELLDYPLDTPADPDWFFERVHPDDKEKMQQAIDLSNQPLRDGRVEVETRWEHPDGDWRYLLIRSQSFSSEDSRVRRAVGAVLDLTAQKELENQFLQSQKMEAIGRLTGAIAHDFNNLLTIILSCTELAQLGLGPDAEVQSELKEVTNAALRAATLTRQLLAFARKQVLNPQRLELGEALRELEPMLRRLMSEKVHIRVLDSDEPLPVKVDRSQLMQVLLNLAVNARDAMPLGGDLVIETGAVVVPVEDPTVLPELAPGDYAQIAVSDNGTGMDSATLERVFEPFFTTKAPHEGSGLGLSTVFGIIRQSEGQVTIDSAPGAGTTVRIHLPLVRT